MDDLDVIKSNKTIYLSKKSGGNIASSKNFQKIGSFASSENFKKISRNPNLRKKDSNIIANKISNEFNNYKKEQNLSSMINNLMNLINVFNSISKNENNISSLKILSKLKATDDKDIQHENNTNILEKSANGENMNDKLNNNGDILIDNNVEIDNKNSNFVFVHLNNIMLRTKSELEKVNKKK